MVKLSDKDKKELINFLDDHKIKNKYTEANIIDEKVKKKIFQLRKKKNLPSYIAKMVSQIKDLVILLKEGNCSKAQKEQVTSALNYFILAEDKIPDYIPIVGYLDDAYIISVVHNKIIANTK